MPLRPLQSMIQCSANTGFMPALSELLMPQSRGPKVLRRNHITVVIPLDEGWTEHELSR